MTPTVRVDTAALRDLGAELVGLAGRLAGDTDAIGDRVADPLIRMALEDVQRDWSKKRHAITSYLTNAGHAAGQAAEAYVRAESAIGRGATPGGPR